MTIQNETLDSRYLLLKPYHGARFEHVFDQWEGATDLTGLPASCEARIFAEDESPAFVFQAAITGPQRLVISLSKEISAAIDPEPQYRWRLMVDDWVARWGHVRFLT